MPNNTTPVRSVTRSYSRGVHFAAYGADKIDLFASRTYSWFEEPTDKEVEDMSRQLFEEVETDVENQLAQIKEERGEEKDKQAEPSKVPF